jgi:diguanylate cyclase (GGDEF)-like protein/PAS domain S-box-containing protein
MEAFKNYIEVIENFYEGVYFVDNHRKITFWNKGAERITGFFAEDVLNKYCLNNILNHVDDKGNKLCLQGCPLHKTIEDGFIREAKVYLHHKEGHRVSVNVRTIPLKVDGKIIGAAEIFTDNSEHKKLIDDLEKLKFIAMYDQLTSLANRRYLDAYLESKMIEYQKLDLSFGVVFLDIDHFKNFNDKYGHDVGDEVLKMVSNTLRWVTSNGGMAGRWGGEEFIVIFPLMGEEKDLYELAERTRMLIENSSLRKEKENLQVTCSMGITEVRKSDTIETLIKRADELMYISKATGRNKVTVG